MDRNMANIFAKAGESRFCRRILFSISMALAKSAPTDLPLVYASPSGTNFMAAPFMQ